MQRLSWLWFLGRCSWRNLLRTPRRTAVSLTAIAAAACAILVFESFVVGVKTTFRSNVITSNYGHFQIFKKGYRENGEDDPFSMNIESIDELRATIEKDVGPVAFIGRRLTFYGLLTTDDDRSFGGVGVGIDAEEERRFLTRNLVVSGKHLADGDEDGAFLGWKLAEKLKLKVGDPVSVVVTTATGSVNVADLTVVGTYKSGITEFDGTMFYVKHAQAASLLRTAGAPQVLVGFPTDDETPLQPALVQAIAAKFPDLEVVHWRTLADFFDNGMGWIESQVGVFRWIVLTIAAIGIVTVFMMSLMERLGEFGTMRALGTSRGSIAAMIFAESVAQSALGSLVGCALGVLVITFGLSAGITMPPPPLMSEAFHVTFNVPWAAIPATLVLCTVVAGGIGLVPAARMARVNIVSALGRNV